ncbi:hypothetical protein PENSOL_c177G00408, partial [Penicillium solitum]
VRTVSLGHQRRRFHGWNELCGAHPPPLIRNWPQVSVCRSTNLNFRFCSVCSDRACSRCCDFSSNF